MRRYRFTISDDPSDRAPFALGGRMTTDHMDGNIQLTGHLADNAELHEPIVDLDNIGLTLLELH